MPELTLNQKLLSIVYHKTHRWRKPYPFNVSRIAKNLHVTPREVSVGLHALVAQGKIKRCDQDGNRVEAKSTCAARLVQYLLDHDCCIEWDKAHRAAVCKEIGVTFNTVRRAVWSLPELINVEYNTQRHPTVIYLLDDEAAREWLQGKQVTATARHRNHYYKYVSGYSRRALKPKPAPAPKLPKYGAKHQILDLLVQNGGALFLGPTAIFTRLGMKKWTYYSTLRNMKAAGLVTHSSQGLFLADADAAASFLAPFSHCQAEQTPKSNLIPPIHPPSREHHTQLKSVTNVTAFSLSPLTPDTSKAAKKLMIWGLVLRKRLEWEISRQLLYYPKNYERGQEKIMDTRRRLAAIDEETDEAYRLLSGRMYGRQKAICQQLLTQLKECLGLGGAILDPLLDETIRRIRSTLPSVENPDCDMAEKLVDFCGAVLPVDCQPTLWVRLFVQYSMSATLSEFVCRGGLDLLFSIQAWNEAAVGFVDQRIAWDICMYMAYLKAHPFNSRFPEQFPSIIVMDGLQNHQQYVSGPVVAEALTYYLGFEDYKLGSLYSIKHQILAALCTKYPVSENGGVRYTTAWDEFGPDLLEEDESGTLAEWVQEYMAGQATAPIVEVPKFSLTWFEAKLNAVRLYGMPGDVEAMNAKVSALKRWPLAPFEEQKDKLVAILNKPCRYAEPALTWAAWDAIVHGQTNRNNNVED